jgi:uncharacterized protein DUF6263
MKTWKLALMSLVLVASCICVTETPAGFRCRRSSSPAAVMPRVQETVDLRWKFEANKPFYVQITTKTDQTMKVMDTDVVQKQTQTSYLHVTPEKKDEKGNWVLGVQFVGIRMSVDIAGNKIEYDSTIPSPQSALIPTLKAIQAIKFNVILTPQMIISRTEGLKEFIRDHSKENPQWEPTLRSILSDNAIKKMFEHVFPPIPPESVRKGTTWSRRTSFVDNLGIFKSTTKYTYEGNKANLEQIKVQPQGSYTLPKNLAGVLRTTKALPGEILFDRAIGRVVSASIPVQLEGKMKIDIGGMITNAALRQFQTITIQVTERNPLSRK